MQLLKDSIMHKGKVLPGDVLKVDSFLNHMIDVELLTKMGEYIHEHFSDCKVDKVLTIEASGIALAYATAQFFSCPMLFAKKSRTSNLPGSVYQAVVHSYTHGTDSTIMVNKDYLTEGENVLIVDDFLATGAATDGLVSLVEQAKANVVGIAAAIEKTYQSGGNALRERGFKVLSLAKIASMEGGVVTFED